MRYFLPPVLFVMGLGAIFTLQIVLPIASLNIFPFNLIGIALFIGGLAMAATASRQFRQLQTNINTFRNPDQMVTTGLFAYTRNPMYLGFVIALLGAAVFTNAISPFFVVVFFWLVTDRWYISFEEAAMQQVFGEEYDRYKSKVRRWI